MASAHAKQSPLGKTERSLAADGKCYFSYAQVVETVSSVVEQVKVRWTSYKHAELQFELFWIVYKINVLFGRSFKS